jgi:hypothetical protein
MSYRTGQRPRKYLAGDSFGNWRQLGTDHDKALAILQIVKFEGIGDVPHVSKSNTERKEYLLELQQINNALIKGYRKMASDRQLADDLALWDTTLLDGLSDEDNPSR